LAGAPAGYIFIHRNVFDFWAVARCHRSPFFTLLFHFLKKAKVTKSGVLFTCVLQMFSLNTNNGNVSVLSSRAASGI
jgi:hypothetical protein